MATSGGSIVWNLNIDSKSFNTGLQKASGDAKDFGDKLDKGLGDASKSAAQKVRDNFLQISATLAGLGIGLNKLTGFMSETVESANKQQAAFIGLNSVAKAFGQNADEATEAARRLSKDGLMTVGDAAKGLKNLLAAGFELPQAIKLMERFKDSASFGRQSALTFGDAVTSATEGIKNGNSILVDNAGVTKNLSVILEEAGFSAQDLMKATTDASVRQALFNGILKETTPQLGDAAKFAETAAGKQAMFAQKTDILKAKIGESLQPALLKLLETLTPIIEGFAKFVQDHPGVVAAFLIITTVGLGLLTVLGGIGLAVAGLGPIFTAFAAVSSVAMGGVSLAFKGMAALVTTPLIMPAIAVGAALAALGLVYDAAQKTKQAVDNTLNAAQTASRINDDTIRTLQNLIKTGTPEQQARARKSLAGLAAGGAFASGTNFAPGGPSLVGERGPEIVNLPRGSEVIPNDKLGSIGNTYHIGTINIASEVDGHKWLRKLTRDQFDVSSGLVPSKAVG